MRNEADFQYRDAVARVLDEGRRDTNRTGIDTLKVHGHHFCFDLAGGFPVLTTKRVAWRAAFAEMLGFLQRRDNAADFRALGTGVWDANANENDAWLANQNRKGPDDLGRIYGVQWRKWRAQGYTIDQVRNVYEHLRIGTDNRREIVLGWNPGELSQMALPPCHALMQFGLTGRQLDLFCYIRSSDIGLGLPFNIAQYAFLLEIMARITGNTAGELHVFCWNLHAYENHLDALTEQLRREPRDLPEFRSRVPLQRLEDIENLFDASGFDLVGYDPHPAIKMEMAV